MPTPTHELTALSERRLSDALGRRGEAEAVLRESIARLTDADAPDHLIAQAQTRLDRVRERP